MKTKFTKVAVEERLPEKDGIYEIKEKIRTTTTVLFEKGNKICEKFWKEKVDYFIEEQTDYVDQVLNLLNEMYNDLEVPKRYESKIKSLLQSLTIPKTREMKKTYKS